MLAISVLATASCTLPLSVDYESLFTDTPQITGKYKDIDGDRFIYECGGAVCIDTLVRDEYLAANAPAPNGQQVILVVRRVLACDFSVSSQVACARSLDGSALVIKKWIRPAGSPSAKP